MSIRNEMEHLVRDEVGRVRKAGNSGYAGCWCVLCETDIIAFALTSLPPLYCRDESTGHAAGIIRASTINDAVQSALKRVSFRPKHAQGTVPTAHDRVALVNYTYEVGTTMVGSAQMRSAIGCTCESCRADTLAYALNRYPAKYGVARRGQRNLHPTYIDFMRYELGMLINQAARVVSARPYH